MAGAQRLTRSTEADWPVEAGLTAACLTDGPADAPKKSGWRGWRRWLERLALQEGEPPRRMAAAFALGVFLSFSPLLGLQVALGMAAAFALRLSRGIVFMGLCANLPAIMIPWYAGTTAAGALMLGIPLAPDFGARFAALLDLPVYRTTFWQEGGDLLWPFMSAFLVGSTAGAFVVAGVVYLSAVRFLGRRNAARASV